MGFAWKQLTLAAALICSGSAAAQTPPELPVGEIRWLSRPSGGDIAKYYPDSASRRGISGWMLLVCGVKIDGRLTRCRAAAEAPTGQNFGKAGLAMSKLFQMTPMTPSGRSVEGAVVQIPLTMTMDGAIPPQTARPGDPGMLVEVLQGGETRGRPSFACPTTAAPELRCGARVLNWAQGVSVHQMSDLIRRARTGISLVECHIGPAGGLETCAVGGKGPPEIGADLLLIAQRFKAPTLTEDKIPTAGGKVILTFDWPTLLQVLDAYEAVAAGR